MNEDHGYGATTASHEPGTEHERPDPDEQEEAAGMRPPGQPGYGQPRAATPGDREKDETASAAPDR